MSRFFSAKYSALVPYTPGEQPGNMQYIKLNTNESPFPPSEKAQKYAAEAAGLLQLYPDPECRQLTGKLAEMCGIAPDELLLTNGSDEILNFAFMAFCDENHPAVFPDISYGFYSVFAQLNNVPYEEIPLDASYRIDPRDYMGIHKNIFIANPNAPTGLLLSVNEIEEIVRSNPDNIVLIDEAYIDFGGESCIPLIRKYDNLIVTQTFSKSRSMAGARLGFGAANRELIRDMNTIKYSTNPYNINRMTMAAGLGVLEDEETTRANCKTIIQNRIWTTETLRSMGFEVLDSCTNFIFARHPKLDGGQTYLNLKEKGILIRHFNKDRLRDFNRITIGTIEQMQAFVNAMQQELEAAE